MQIFGYEVDGKRVLIGGGVIVIMTGVTAAIIYHAVDSACYAGSVSLPTIQGQSACELLRGTFADPCPAGFPSLYDLCVVGFRQGANLVVRGVEFVPSLVNNTVCNNHFGFNSTLQACYDVLNDECWRSASGGFVWQTTVNAFSNATATLASAFNNTCHYTAAITAGAAAGLTLFTGLAKAGATTLLSYCNQKKSAHLEPLSDELLQEGNDDDRRLRPVAA